VREGLRESAAAFRGVFRNPTLRRLQLAWAGSVAGQYAFVIVIAVFAYRHGGAAGVGAMMLVRTIPAAVIGPLVSAAGDRYRQERVMLLADAGRAALVAAMVADVALHGPAWPVFVLAAGGPVLATMFHPAQSALLPFVASTPDELTAANVASSTIESVSLFAGPAVAGLVLGVWGMAPALAVTVATFAWSALLVARITPPARAPAAERAHAGGASFAAEAFAGFGAVARVPALRLLIGLYTAQMVVAGAMGVLVVVAAERLLHMGSSGVGWLYTACGVGGIAGSVVSMALVGRRRLAGDLRLGLLLWGIPFLVVGVWAHSVVALAMLALLGIGNTLVDVSAMTLLQRNAPEAVRARVFGVLETLFAVTAAVGAVAAPALIGLAGIRTTLVATGVFLPALTLLAWRALATLDTAADLAQVDLLRRIPLFAPLPAPTLEGLARALVPVELAAGETLFEAGEAGDRFYVIESGELAVELAIGTKVESAGGFVGEIALLRDVPRTATVRARTDARLLALERDEFLAAVTGHARARDTAEHIATERLALSPV